MAIKMQIEPMRCKHGCPLVHNWRCFDCMKERAESAEQAAREAALEEAAVIVDDLSVNQADCVGDSLGVDMRDVAAAIRGRKGKVIADSKH